MEEMNGKIVFFLKEKRRQMKEGKSESEGIGNVGGRKRATRRRRPMVASSARGGER